MNRKIKNGAMNRFYGSVFCCLAFVALLLPVTASVPVSLRELHVATTPVGASVFIDGKNKGRTPVTVTLSDAKPHLLDITKNGYNNVRRTIVVNDGQKLPIDISLEPVLGLALIKSIPVAANVRINDIDRGKTPLLVTDLPIGTYRIHITAPGYLKQDLELALRDRTPVAVNAELVSDSAGISVISVPAGASVVIDGAVQGVTPCEIAGFPGGECDLSVTLDGYAEYKRKFRLVAGKNEKLDITLSPLPASLQVVTMPVGAKVYIDNQFKGISPFTFKKIQPGTYQIKTEMRGYDSVEKEVVLNRGDNSIEEFMLLPNTGALEITSEPSNVKVFIDGKWSGLTTAKSNETDKVSEVLVLDKIPSGSHEIKLSMKGYFTQNITVDIERDKTVVQHVSLLRRFIPNCEVRTASEVYQGVLVQIDPVGNIKLEIAPGVMKIITAPEVISRKPLRVEVQE